MFYFWNVRIKILYIYIVNYKYIYIIYIYPIQLFVHTQIVEVDLALYHMYILADWGHLLFIVSDDDQFAFSMLCLIT